MALERLLALSASSGSNGSCAASLRAFQSKLVDLGIEPEDDVSRAYPEIPEDLVGKNPDLAVAVGNARDAAQELKISKGALFSLIVVMEASKAPSFAMMSK